MVQVRTYPPERRSTSRRPKQPEELLLNQTVAVVFMGDRQPVTGRLAAVNKFALVLEAEDGSKFVLYKHALSHLHTLS
jgi:sRNA-binding regulator protein Hfq